ncbi:hypothetical protein [Devosia sp. DBB001]|nr:hypothetical protein [Devosia sp. DBB001]
MRWVFKPIFAVGDEGPGSYLPDPVRQGVNVAADIVAEPYLLGNPIGVEKPALSEIGIETCDNFAMMSRGDVPVIGRLAHFPEQLYGFRVGCEPPRFVARDEFERNLVDCGRRTGQRPVPRGRIERAAQRIDGREIQLRTAPLQDLDRLEVMGLKLGDEFFLEGVRAAGNAKRAVAHVTPGAARDLAELGRGQRAGLAAIELGVVGKGDVVDIEIEAHADGVGGDKEIHFPALVEFDLRVAGTGRQRAHDHGGPAALAADEFGDGVNLRRREGDDGRALGLARNFPRAGIGERGKARPVDDLGMRQQLTDDRGHGGRAHEQGLGYAAGVEDAVGEDVATIEIDRRLHLVDRDTLDRHIGGHGFDGAHPVARAGRHDALFARHQRHGLLPDPVDHAVIDLAREQAQRQPDHAGGMRQHALDGKPGLAGIGRPKDGLERLGGKGGVHWRGIWSPIAAKARPQRPLSTCPRLAQLWRKGGVALILSTKREQTQPESMRITESDFVLYCMLGVIPVTSRKSEPC